MKSGHEPHHASFEVDDFEEYSSINGPVNEHISIDLCICNARLL